MKKRILISLSDTNELEKNKLYDCLENNNFKPEFVEIDNDLFDEKDYGYQIQSNTLTISRNQLVEVDALIIGRESISNEEKKEYNSLEEFLTTPKFLRMYEAYLLGKEIYIYFDVPKNIEHELSLFGIKKIQNIDDISKNINREEYDTSVNITNIDFDWKKIKSACMTTISKAAGPKEPSDEWKRKLLICEHSPIRRGNVSWKWNSIPYAISTHFARHHEGCEKYVGTERQDRTKYNRKLRSQMNTVPMEMDANIQALINISNKRLCMCADETTRKYWYDFIEELKTIDDNIYWSCVPSCVYRGGCPELFGECKFYENLMKDCDKEDCLSLTKRYDIYYNYRQKKTK